MTKKHALIIGGIRSCHTYLYDCDYRVTWINKKSLSVASDITAKSQRLILLSDADEHNNIVSIAYAIHEKDPIDAVFCFHDALQLAAIHLCQKLHLDFVVNERLLSLTRNKFKMREALQQHDEFKVTAQVVERKSALQQFLASHPAGDWIVKPVDGAGSLAIKKVNTQDDLSNVEDFIFPSIVESYLDGPEYSVETFSIDGKHYFLGATAKTIEPNSHIELAHSFPAKLSLQEKSDIQAYIFRFLNLIGLENGPAHTEIKLSQFGPKIIETHTRLGGDQIPDMVKASTGIDLYKLTTMQQAGVCSAQLEAELADIQYHHYCTIQYLIPQCFDTQISAINLSESVKNNPFKAEIQINKKVGDHIKAFTNSADRLGYVYMVSSNREQLAHQFEQVLSQIEIQYSDKGNTRD